MGKRLPDFIIGGAPRSGTTWLYHLLEHHPQIYMASPLRPEPKFFLVDEEYRKGIDYYADKWFSGVTSSQLAGEKSTNYLESQPAAERIHYHLPAVKLIFILREPVARAYSNYLWSQMNDLESEDFETALQLEEERTRNLGEDSRYSRPHAYYSRGLYADCLRRFFDRFPKEQICCLRYEDIIGQPQELASTVHAFLAVERRPQDAVGLGVINPSVGDTRPTAAETRKKLGERYVRPNHDLAVLLGPKFEIWE